MSNASKGMAMSMAASMNRRDMLKRGAVVGGTLVWTVPVVQSLSLTPAHAESPSAPGNPGNPDVPNNPAPNNPEPNNPAPNNPPAAQPGAAPSGGSGLAETGTTIPVLGAVAAGAAAVAIGAAAVAMTRNRAATPDAVPAQENAPDQD